FLIDVGTHELFDRSRIEKPEYGGHIPASTARVEEYYIVMPSQVLHAPFENFVGKPHRKAWHPRPVVQYPAAREILEIIIFAVFVLHRSTPCPTVDSDCLSL